MSGTARSGPTGADVHEALEAARRFHEAGKWDEARDIYDQILSYLPDQPDACHLRGLIALRDEEFGTAEALIGRAVAADPGVADYHGNLGIALRRQGRLGDAEASYRRVLAIDSGHAEAHANLGTVLYESGAGDDAIPCFERALASRTDYPLALTGLGSIRFERGDFAAAERLLRRAAEVDRGYAFGAACHLGDEYEARIDAALGVRLLAEAPALCGELPPPDGGLVVTTHCDSEFFRRHGKALILSLEGNSPGTAFHLHLFNADAPTHAEVAALRDQLAATELTVTRETVPDPSPAYYVNMRFVRLHQLMESSGREVLSIDADSLIRGDLGGIGRMLGDHDLAILTRFGNVQIHLKVLGSALHVRPTPAARTFLARLAAYTLSCHRDGTLGWFLDQLLIYVIHRRTVLAGEALSLGDLPTAVVDHELGPGALAWNAKGGRMTGGQFWRAQAEILDAELAAGATT